MIVLTKEDGPADLDGVTHMSIGVAWDPTSGASGGVMGLLRRKAGTDLDLIAIALRDSEPVRLAGLDSAWQGREHEPGTHGRRRKIDDVHGPGPADSVTTVRTPSDHKAVLVRRTG